MGRVGLLGRSGAGACPNLLQRLSGTGSAARRSAEYQRFSSGAPARSGPLQQIWTNCAPAGPCRGRGPPDGGHGGRPDDRTGPASTPPGDLTGHVSGLPNAFFAERCTSHSKVQFQPSFSSAKYTSRRTRPGRMTASAGATGRHRTGSAARANWSRPRRFSRARRFPVERAPPSRAFDWEPARSRKSGARQ